MILVFSDLEQRDVYLIDGLQCLPIPDYPNYLAAKVGKLYSIPRTKTRGGWLAGSPDAAGYIKHAIRNERTSRYIFLHQAVLLAWIGLCPEGEECRHLDDDKANDALWNLAYGTDAQNKIERDLNGKTSRGEKHKEALRLGKVASGYIPSVGEESHNNILTSEQVRDIKFRLASGQSGASIARFYDIHVMTVSNIKTGKTWSHLV